MTILRLESTFLYKNMTLDTSKITEKFNIGEKIGVFKKLFWLFVVIIIIVNIALFYFVDGMPYFIAFIVGNVISVWMLIPVFVWIGKTYLIDVGMEVAETLKDEARDFTKDQVEK